MPNESALALLRDVTAIPTAAGREQAVSAWIGRWLDARPDLLRSGDSAGNLIVSFRGSAEAPSLGRRALFITAHLDHPAFVVERIIGPGTLLATFRGGVRECYFREAPVEVISMAGAEGAAGVSAARAAGTVTQHAMKEPFPECLIELHAESEAFMPGDIARWALPAPRIDGDIFSAPACDDLSAVAAALAVMDRLRGNAEARHVRLLFTRAEEVGFLGAIAACKERTMPIDSRVIALENSRSFAESPIGGGPVVRVGDRLSVFHPGLTGAVGKVAERLADQRGDAFRWQRRLMPGGACEASVFQAYGYEATCVCLPLGNYHNMADLERVQAGDAGAIAAARVAPEFISVSDYLNMIALLEACALSLEGVEPMTARLERVYAEKAFVLRS
jgi:endoglucanase